MSTQYHRIKDREIIVRRYRQFNKTEDSTEISLRVSEYKLNETTIKKYFSNRYGILVSLVKGNSRSTGFDYFRLRFNHFDIVDKILLNVPHTIDGVLMEIHRGRKSTMSSPNTQQTTTSVIDHHRSESTLSSKISSNVNINDVNNSLNKSEHTLENNIVQCNKYELEIESSKDEHLNDEYELKNENLKLQLQINNLILDKERLEKLLEQKQTERVFIQHESKEQSDKIDSIILEHKKIIDQYEQNIDSTTKKLMEAKVVIDQFEENVLFYKNDRKRLLEDKETLRKENENLKAQIEENKKQIEDLSIENLTLKSTNDCDKQQQQMEERLKNLEMILLQETTGDNDDNNTSLQQYESKRRKRRKRY
ncbi:unnamed protein product [Didymodactylos carnosus]|uniref:RRM domain-containing protein n=1 Tax=Didymodactylos carnosus TaxID=1234261 RepID=A0A8S2F226_9BILA|nr:unnamed protein product [Didymodactylos carnosus]CAF4168243.1 unnamed protein product [Didymodactylos carnosus]